MSLFKSSGQFPNIIFITFCPATLGPIYDATLFCLGLSVLWEWYLTHRDYVKATRTFVANMVSRYISKGGTH